MTEPLPQTPGRHLEEPATGWRTWVKLLGTVLGITVVAATTTLAAIGLVIMAFVLFLTFTGGSLWSNK
jgi:hypothetical protein